jgi:hypothetical protein
VALVAVALWLGVMGFFAFAVAPAAFGALDRDAAGRLVSAVFPRYYAVGTLLGAVALAAALPRAVAGGGARSWAAALLLVAMVLVTLAAWLVVLPAAHAARDAMRQRDGRADAPAAARFARLHRLSTAMNAVVMLAGVTVVALEAAARR